MPKEGVEVGGGVARRLGKGLRKFGGPRRASKFEAQLMQVKIAKGRILRAVTEKMQQLNRYWAEEKAETMQVSQNIEGFIKLMGGFSKALDTLVDEVITGEVVVKTRGQEKKALGEAYVSLKGKGTKGAVASAGRKIAAFSKFDERVKKDNKKLQDAIKHDEQMVKNVLIAICYLQLLIQKFYELDREEQALRNRTIIATRRMRRQIDQRAKQAEKMAREGEAAP